MPLPLTATATATATVTVTVKVVVTCESEGDHDGHRCANPTAEGEPGVTRRMPTATLSMADRDTIVQESCRPRHYFCRGSDGQRRPPAIR